MSSQHLSDEAVAAFADGVLGGLARERAARHVNGCDECRHAVKVQREAAYALRSAGAPPLPSGLMDRLRTVPMTTTLPAPQTALDEDGTPMLATFAPMAALVPSRAQRGHRTRPYITTAAIVALAGALTAGSVAHGNTPTQTGTVHPVNKSVPMGGEPPAVFHPVEQFRGATP